jgi:NitT/TauT family transport system ATP-binding protein
MMGLKLEGIEKSFGGNRVLKAFHLTVSPGELVALMGPSGCGKTTVLNILSGIIAPDRGQIMGTQGKRITYLFAENRLILHKGAEANLLAAMVHPDMARAREILRSLGIEGDAASRPIRELSFGMARRVAIARAMAHDGEIVLYDEPVYGLDEKTRAMVLSRLQEHLAGKTGVLVTHEADVAQALCQRVVAMEPLGKGLDADA